MSASGGDGRGALPEHLRRAYLEAMGIPVWVPRAGAAGAEPPAAEASADGDLAAAAREAPAEVSPAPAEARPRRPAAGAGGEPSTAGPADTSGDPPADDEPPPIPAELADELGAQADAAHEEADSPAAAVASMDWDTLDATIRACRACGLCESRTQAVPGVGNRSAELLVIGEAPGREEDRRGEPFVGRAGQLLDRMLAAIGLDRDTVFITNVLKCRPPENRDPRPEEVRACAGYLRRQIELIGPRAILSVGRVSAQSLLETGAPIGRLRGNWQRFGPQGTPLLVTYHPAYLLRQPAEKRKAWADLKAVRDQLRA